MYKSLVLCLPLCLAVGSDRVQNITSVLSHPSQVSNDAMPVDDPIGFLQECLHRFDAQNIGGYEMVMLKQERLGGQLQPSEEIEVRYRTKPHSVVAQVALKGRSVRPISPCSWRARTRNMLLINPAGIAGRPRQGGGTGTPRRRRRQAIGPLFDEGVRPAEPPCTANAGRLHSSPSAWHPRRCSIWAS